ncbi:hypothetical protein ADUPG1_000637, partial [Aduncisulcus paluster]
MTLYKTGLTLLESGEEYHRLCVWGLIIGILVGIIFLCHCACSKWHGLAAFVAGFLGGCSSLAGFYLNVWCFTLPIILIILLFIIVHGEDFGGFFSEPVREPEMNDIFEWRGLEYNMADRDVKSPFVYLCINAEGLGLMLLIWGYLEDNVACVIFGMLPILVALSICLFLLFSRGKKTIQFVSMMVQAIALCVCLYFWLYGHCNRCILTTVIMICIDTFINMVVGTVFMSKTTSHDLASIGSPLFMSLFTLLEALFVVSTIALWITKADWKLSLISTILALFFTFFEVISVKGFFVDKVFVDVFGEAFFKGIATSIFAFLWIPMLVLPIFYDFVLSESYSLHVWCWASGCLAIISLVLMLSGWKLYGYKHLRETLWMDLLVGFASTSLVAGLWLCHNQALRISMVVLGEFCLIVFVVSTLFIYSKEDFEDELPALGFL